MVTSIDAVSNERVARCIEASKRVQWDIDRDVLRGRRFDAEQKFLPDGLLRAHTFAFLSTAERRYLSRVQGRTYANMFRLIERYINDKVLELRGDHTNDRAMLEALDRFSQEEIKHQELFRRVEALTAEKMPPGYRFVPDANDVARAVLSKSTWAVLALTLDVELFTLAHYRESIAPDAELSPLFKDVFLYHWKEESQHAIIDELELLRIDAGITEAERDSAVNDFIALVGAVDGLLQLQAAEDARFFAKTCGRDLTEPEDAALHASLLGAYRWQYILSGAELPQFREIFLNLITNAQAERIQAALSSFEGN